MVTPMTEQSGRQDPSDRPGSDRSGSGGSGQERAGAERPRQRTPGADVLSDLQRWLIRSSAKNMRREIGGQVRRSLGGERSDKSDVWGTATTEIPPEVGEAPECQWCPICRAARRMRDSGSGLTGQLSGAGDAVASTVQDAINALDSILFRAGGYGEQRDRGNGDRSERDRSERDRSERDRSERDRGEPAKASDPNPWPAATLPDAAATEDEQLDAAATEDEQLDAAATEDEQPDGPGHGPDDRR
jgi:hypothetical protein